MRQALEKTITELCIPVVERCIKIALTTCESIIKKVGFNCYMYLLTPVNVGVCTYTCSRYK